MEAHCVNLDVTYQNQVLKDGQHGQILNETSNKAKINKEIEVLKTINIELEQSVAKLLIENEKLHKENEHLKQTYKDLYDSIKKTRVQTKDLNDSLIAQINTKTVENADLKAQIQEKSERPKFSKPRFASQVDMNNVLSKPVTPHYLPKAKESAPAKPHHVNAPSSSRNSKKESYGSNDMAHKYYLEETKKKTQDKNRNLKPRKMPSTRTHHTPNACTSKPRSNNQKCRNWPASKSSVEMLKAVQKADHSRNPSSFSDFKHFIQPNKIRNSKKPVDPTSDTHKPGRKIVTGHSFSPNKSFAMHEKTNTPRSCLWWIPMGRIFNTGGLKWVPTGKIFTSSTTKVDCEPSNGSNECITNPYECDQTLNVSAGTLNLSVGTFCNFERKDSESTPELQSSMASVDNTSGLLLKEKKGVRFNSNPVIILKASIPSKRKLDLSTGIYSRAWSTS
ncbi:hypothetical protein Tco_0798249 [Tanacetum coccineum]